ncbi:hypothetical protein EV201_3216 [Ancylomarina subtilis]|uniref:Uncharacterized protein n=1 Tax=Ancylomarina subtilis TaxID=1639035 RepID=A0A4Q7V703_9BACT|nr:tetratricopeptide repeat protein [Ancylomarina subtilis]RZT91210.1 hypothetical protein EV201_3216 [Ancylomarina subtilis]
MRKILVVVGLFLLFSLPVINAQANQEIQIDSINKPLFKPFIERYILDELKSLRRENLELNKQVSEKIAQAKLESSDRAINYTTSTINNIFYIITAAASLLVLLGWKSLSDIKKTIKKDTSSKIQHLTADYERRLEVIEKQAKVRSEIIVDTQNKISVTNSLHSLWMRAGIEKSEEEKISIYDEILEINPNDIEAMTYKADALLEIGEVRWALNLVNAAIEKDNKYALAFWQRACAYAQLEKEVEAIKDLEKAIELSETFVDEVGKEIHFDKLKNNKRFKAIVNS